LELIPEQDLILVTGNADPVPPNTAGLTSKLLLILLRHGPVTPGGPDGLVKLAERLEDPLPLKPVDGVSGRSLLRLFDAEATEIGSDLIAFVRGPMGVPGKGVPWGIAAARLRPDAPEGIPKIEWFQQGLGANDPLYVYDPYWDIRHGAQSSCASQLPSNQVVAAPLIRVNHFDFAQVAAGPGAGKYLYAACNSFNQVLEFKLDSFLASGFLAQRKLNLEVPAPNVGSSSAPYPDDLYHVTVRHDPAYPTGPVDLLYVVGQQYVHVAERTAASSVTVCGIPVSKPSKEETQQFFGTAAAVSARVMQEFPQVGGPGSGDFADREHLWVLAPDIQWPWSVFDMTDRNEHPVVEPPFPLDRRYAPGGTDGAAAYPAWGSVYATNFGGLVRYEALPGLGTPPTGLGLQPLYDSYSPARVTQTPLGTLVFNTEQFELADWNPQETVLANKDVRGYAATGRGRAVEWKIDPVSKRPFRAENNPDKVQVIPPIAGASLEADTESKWLSALPGCNSLSNWSESYSLCVATGRGMESGRPYVLLDLALQRKGDETTGCKFPGQIKAEDAILLGRYWLPQAGETTGVWQVLHLTADGLPNGDVRNLIGFDVNDIEISADGQFALVACTRGLFVVALSAIDAFELPGGGTPTPWQRDQAWKLTDTFYSVPTPAEPNPFGGDQGFEEVKGVAWIGTSGVVMSLSGPNDTGAVALYGFGHHLKALTEFRHLLQDRPEDVSVTPSVTALDEISNVDYYTGGAIETFDLGGGVYRVYATSDGTGSLAEFQVLPGAQPLLNQVGYHASTTHFVETPDCRPCLWPGFGPLPVLVVPRFQQTILMLRATPTSGGG
jgi:hypothetical protein